MTTILYTHPACLDHDTSPNHPESANRLRKILEALETPNFDGLIRRESPLASLEQIQAIHPKEHVNSIFSKIPSSGYCKIDADTIVSMDSKEAALRSAGAVIAAVDSVMSKEANNAFCAIRPPGHHAETNRSMGFCLFNNIALGAEHVMKTYGLKKIAVIDFDVHHGNGTQEIFMKNPNLFYASTHQSPLYPGTGNVTEIGPNKNIINCPLPPGSGSEEFREAMYSLILPSLIEFAPQFLFISAGFDAHIKDPLAQMELTNEDFAWITEKLCEVSEQCCFGRIVSALEGGYDLNALAEATAEHVETLMALS